ncbi:hypothetical protein [uncultured Weeksella sp.]|uniref:hypothetical protein n=1 Tax=uncultured Weeksella sp. TaxID=1161389 RepID=UPI00259BA00A|nr:hypothetical protein [uncultured Weeksella sp.]
MSPECSIIKEIDVSLGLYFIKQKTMNALIIGATGATGKELVQQLLEHPAYSSITIFVRKNTFKVHPKLTVHCIDFSKPEKWQQWVLGDVLFSALGTTLKKAGSKKINGRSILTISIPLLGLPKKTRYRNMYWCRPVEPTKTRFSFTRK